MRDSASSGIFHEPDEIHCHVRPAEAEPLCTVTPLPARLCLLLAKQSNSDRRTGLVRLPPRLPAFLLLGPNGAIHRAAGVQPGAPT